MKNKILSLIGFILVCELAGIIGAFATASSVGSWYAELIKPPFNPPNWIFGPVWTSLYALMGIAAWLIFQSDNEAKSKTLKLFFVHLVVNAAWSFMFFGLKSTALGLGWIVILDIFILWVLVAFWRISKLAGSLLIPYFLWASFATYLSCNLWLLNK